MESSRYNSKSSTPQSRRADHFRAPRRSRLQRLRESGAVWISVIVLHLGLVGGLLTAFVGRAGIEPGPSRTMVVLLTPDEHLPAKRVEPITNVKVQLIPPHFEAPALSPIPVAIESAGSILKAAPPASPPFERLISEAQAENPKFLQQFCAQQVREVTGSDPRGTVVMMIRVEADGHVSDSKIEESSGEPGPDGVVQACITGVGVFEAHHSGPGTVASWQRIHWTWEGS